MASTLHTPGVHITEINAFPNSVVPVATAVPVFIGYTARADYKGSSFLNTAVQINSLQDYFTFYGAMPDSGPAPASDLQQYVPVYHAVPSQGKGELTLDSTPLDLLPDPTTIYHLYNSIRLFYQNGGGTAFIVSVGFMGPPPSPSTPMPAGSPLVNPKVSLADLQAGLQVAAQETLITLIVIPDAMLLTQADCATLMQSTLAQCGELRSRVALLDVHGAESPDPDCWQQPGGVIENFRTHVGTNHLDYGIAYFPFLVTTIAQDQDINFINLGGGHELAAVLPDAAVEPVKTILAQIQAPPAAGIPTAQQLENALRVASDAYRRLHDLVLRKINTLPPSGAMAGVYTLQDNSVGVWQAPANVGINAAIDTTLKITDTTQASLNVDPVSGKSINAIRFFAGFGIKVWGARTLDGNSQDWRYVNVRRTLIYLEQSLKQALHAAVFLPNAPSTWALVQSMAASFLTSQWSQGALVGSSAASSFSVSIGLGRTMTSDDILNGVMILSVQVAVAHPQEFITITLSQKMQS